MTSRMAALGWVTVSLRRSIQRSPGAAREAAFVAVTSSRDTALG
jgi:hypothetical protein